VRPERLGALTDGIVAIAITLLVLDLPKPVSSAHLVHELLAQWPSYTAYLVSFLTVGIVWIEHHGLMGAVRLVNRRLLELSLLFLLFVSVIPWPTALAAEHGRAGGSAAEAVAVLYAATMMGMGFSITLIWRYLSAHPELVLPAAAPPALAHATRRSLIGALAYVPAIALAFISPLPSSAIDAAIYFAVSQSDVSGLVHRAALATREYGLPSISSRMTRAQRR
jgi:uncharacterized membrane protein